MPRFEYARIQMLLVFVSCLAAAAGACSPDRSFHDSPLAGEVPDCPAGTEETDALFFEPSDSRGSYYYERGATTVTERLCRDGSVRWWFKALTFELAGDADAYLEEIPDHASPNVGSEWMPQSSDAFLLTRFDSTADECLAADDGDSLSSCTVSQTVIVRIATTVVEVSIEAPGEVVGPPKDFSCGARPSNARHQVLWEECLELSLPRVVGSLPGEEALLEMDAWLRVLTR